MKIGEVARDAGISTKTIRYYEQLGLLPAPRRAPNGYRDYDATAISRLLFIRDAQASGLTLNEIASTLELRGQGETSCEHVIDLLERHLDEMDRHIEELNRTRSQLAAMTRRAKRLDPASCTDPDRCQTIAVGPHAGSLQSRGHLHGTPRRHSHS